jgi:DNA-damage-inducible protein D
VNEYTQWRNFTKVIDKAMLACKTSGHDVLSDFAEISKIVEAGVTSKSMKDYELSRYACYLIVQNSDLRKGLDVRDKILDFVRSTELIANLFRISQTEEKLKCDKIDTAEKANSAHYSVGREVRSAIERIGGNNARRFTDTRKEHCSN